MLSQRSNVESLSEIKINDRIIFCIAGCLNYDYHKIVIGNIYKVYDVFPVLKVKMKGRRKTLNMRNIKPEYIYLIKPVKNKMVLNKTDIINILGGKNGQS